MAFDGDQRNVSDSDHPVCLVHLQVGDTVKVKSTSVGQWVQAVVTDVVSATFFCCEFSVGGRRYRKKVHVASLDLQFPVVSNVDLSVDHKLLHSEQDEEVDEEADPEFHGQLSLMSLPHKVFVGDKIRVKDTLAEGEVLFVGTKPIEPGDNVEYIISQYRPPMNNGQMLAYGDIGKVIRVYGDTYHVEWITHNRYEGNVSCSDVRIVQHEEESLHPDCILGLRMFRSVPNGRDGMDAKRIRRFRCEPGYAQFLPAREVEVLPQKKPDVLISTPAPSNSQNLKESCAQLVGLSAVAENFEKLRRVVEIQMKRSQLGVVYNRKPFHFVFRGSTSIGMSSVARILAHHLRDLKVLDEGHLIQFSEKDYSSMAKLDAGTEYQTMEKLWQAASGGLLMLKNPHQFCGQSWSTYLAERLDEMASKCATERDPRPWLQPCLVLAMPNEAVLPDALQHVQFWVVDFPSYSIDELVVIFKALVEKKKFKIFKDVTSEHLATFIGNIVRSSENHEAALQFALEEVVSRQTERVWSERKEDRDGLTLLKKVDFISGLTLCRENNIKAALTKLDHVVGLAGVKSFVKTLYAQLKLEVEKYEAGLKPSHSRCTLHMIFSGNPGTGKTTIARIVAELLSSMGLLRKGHLVEVDRASLVAGYCGQTALKTKAVVESAMGGVLFIDEAYTLFPKDDGRDSFGKEALDTLMKMIEDRRQELVVILAGYPHDMKKLVKANPGIKSRFPTEVLFEDYSLVELHTIAEIMLKEEALSVSKDGKMALSALLQEVHSRGVGKNGNARAVRNLVEKAQRHMAVRLMHDPGKNRSKETLCTLEAFDFQ